MCLWTLFSNFSDNEGSSCTLELFAEEGSASKCVVLILVLSAFRQFDRHHRRIIFLCVMCVRNIYLMFKIIFYMYNLTAVVYFMYFNVLQ